MFKLLYNLFIAGTKATGHSVGVSVDPDKLVEWIKHLIRKQR